MYTGAMWNYDKPLALADALGETPKAYAALLAYYEMGTDRSYRSLVGSGNVRANRGQIEHWATKYNWQARIVRAQELETAARQDAERTIWLERRRDVVERSYTLASRLFDRAEEMLAWPIHVDQVKRERVVTRDGDRVVEQTIVRLPAKWQPRDAAAFLDIGAKLARQAAGLDDKAAQVNLNVTPEAIAAMSDEELAALLDRLKG